ncbi:hypothetical protein ABIC03_002413 [Bradyrhizobium sp. RT6a]
MKVGMKTGMKKPRLESQAGKRLLEAEVLGCNTIAGRP